MSGIYLDWLVDVLREAGCIVNENGTTDGWQHRARGSGGFPEVPLGIQWHHTASSTSPENDLAYMINGSDDAPIGNLYLDRNGEFWPIAAGAANCAGKGGPLTLSRGTIPLDSGNTRSVAIEAANDGLGQGWPVAQIDAYFRGSNAINAKLGNLPSDIFTHNVWAPDRKIDPAEAGAVQGLWRPSGVTSSDTWSNDDIRAECTHRAGSAPTPPPLPKGELVFTIIDVLGIDAAIGGMMDGNGIIPQATWLSPGRYDACISAGAPIIELSAADLINVDLLGPMPDGLSAADFANHIE